ncbi:hypothetical protein PanWU01x14_114740, partial [Parasponia andersonii]
AYPFQFLFVTPHHQSSRTISLVINPSPALRVRTTLRRWFFTITINSRPSLLTFSRTYLGHPDSSSNEINGGKSSEIELVPPSIDLLALEIDLDDADGDDDPPKTVRYDSADVSRS